MSETLDLNQLPTFKVFEMDVYQDETKLELYERERLEAVENGYSLWIAKNLTKELRSNPEKVYLYFAEYGLRGKITGNIKEGYDAWRLPTDYERQESGADYYKLNISERLETPSQAKILVEDYVRDTLL